MRRLVGVVLAVIMLGATTAVPVASAGSLSWEPTEAGQHVEVPWAGVAITFPVDWEVTVHPEAWPKVTTDEGREFDTGVPVYRNALSSKGPMDEGFDSCTVYSYAYHALTPIDIAYPLARIHGLGMTRLGTIELPAGETGFMRAKTPRGEQVMHTSIYVWPTDPGYVFLWRTSYVRRPEARWRSIAETFELLGSAAKTAE